MDLKITIEKGFKIKLPADIVDKWHVREGDQLLARIEKDQLLLHLPTRQQKRPSALDLALEGPWFTSVSAEEIEQISEEEQQRMATDEKSAS